MMVLAAATLMMAVPASSFVPCASRLFLGSAVGSGAATPGQWHLMQHAVFRRGQAGGATGICMADELGRIGRLAKDKLFDAKNFIEDSGKADGGINFKGAGAGAVAGGASLSSCPSFHPHFVRPFTFSRGNVRVA